MDALRVYLRDVKIGTLEDATNGLVFRYEPSYVQSSSAEPLSVAFPVRAEPYSGPEVEIYFSNLLPDDYVRTRIGEVLKIPRDNTFALLAAIGGDCAGAVALYPEGVDPVSGNAEYRKLEDAEAVRILSDLEKRPLNVGENDFRISGAGAQDKLVACVNNGHVLLPLNGTPSTHIIKPEIRNYPGSVQNEYFAMKLAAACGHEVAECEILQLGGNSYYVTSRYDRESLEGKTCRLHQEDFCQLLKIDPRHKYEAVGGPGIAECYALLNELCLSAQERVSFLERLIFNFLVGNGDAHGKNFSVLYRDGRCTLAPMYDIMSTTVYPEVGGRMAMKIDGEYHFKWITANKFVRQAQRLGIRPQLMRALIKSQVHKILRAAPELASRVNRCYPSKTYERILIGIEARCAQLGGGFDTTIRG